MADEKIVFGLDLDNANFLKASKEALEAKKKIATTLKGGGGCKKRRKKKSMPISVTCKKIKYNLLK